MLNKDSIQFFIFDALKSINEECDPSEQILITVDTRLFGADAALDSLSLVSVIVDVEAAISDAIGREISLTDDRAMSQTVSPFSNVSTLTNYILFLLSEAA
jgi:acyl carrier protein